MVLQALAIRGKRVCHFTGSCLVLALDQGYADSIGSGDDVNYSTPHDHNSIPGNQGWQLTEMACIVLEPIVWKASAVDGNICCGWCRSAIMLQGVQVASARRNHWLSSGNAMLIADTPSQIQNACCLRALLALRCLMNCIIQLKPTPLRLNIAYKSLRSNIFQVPLQFMLLTKKLHFMADAAVSSGVIPVSYLVPKV